MFTTAVLIQKCHFYFVNICSNNKNNNNKMSSDLVQFLIQKLAIFERNSGVANTWKMAYYVKGKGTVSR